MGYRAAVISPAIAELAAMLGAEVPPWADSLVAAAAAAGEDIDAGLNLAEKFGAQLPQPGGGQTLQRWACLAAVAAQDLTAARVLEAHSDALAIVVESGDVAPVGTWGVFAAEAPGVQLRATRTGPGWSLSGTKAWCSLGGQLDHALVTANMSLEQGPAGESVRGLFSVDLGHPSVQTNPAAGWVSRGLRNVPSGPVHFHETPACTVGGASWYLKRDGFSWGGIGVAACWFGAAWALFATLAAAAAKRGGELAALSVGRADLALSSAALALRDAANRIDRGEADGVNGEVLALRTRTVVVVAAERVLREVGLTLGPAPLAFDEEHARRVADLEIYLSQHHGDRDVAALGRAILADAAPAANSRQRQ
jgi:alkylation response protein AidB-like acyl-CoA dehydrogenase